MLETETGSAAEALYHRLGYVAQPPIPGHALRPDGTPGASTPMWRSLTSSESPSSKSRARSRSGSARRR
jgi:hypothetical protein